MIPRLRAPRVAAAVAVVLSALACAGPQQSITREASKPTPPAWIATPPKDPTALFVVGVKTGAHALDEGKDAAWAKASEQAAAFVEAKVRSEFEATSSTREDRDRAEERIRVTAAARVRDLTLVDEYHERTRRIIGSYFEETFDVYVLARLPLEAAAAARSRLNQDREARARRALEDLREARKVRAAGDRSRALALLVEAGTFLDELDPSTPIDDRELPDAAALAARVGEQLRALEGESRSVDLELDERAALPADGLASIETELSAALAEKGISVVEHGARFKAVIGASARPSGQVFGQDVVHVSARATLFDAWSRGAQVGAAEREGKGFGRGGDAATHEAARNAGKDLGHEVAEALARRLEAERAAD